MTALKQIALYGCGILALAGLMSGGCAAFGGRCSPCSQTSSA